MTKHKEGDVPWFWQYEYELFDIIRFICMNISLVILTENILPSLAIAAILTYITCDKKRYEICSYTGELRLCNVSRWLSDKRYACREYENLQERSHYHFCEYTGYSGDREHLEKYCELLYGPLPNDIIDIIGDILTSFTTIHYFAIDPNDHTHYAVKRMSRVNKNEEVFVRGVKVLLNPYHVDKLLTDLENTIQKLENRLSKKHDDIPNAYDKLLKFVANSRSCIHDMEASMTPDGMDIHVPWKYL